MRISDWSSDVCSSDLIVVAWDGDAPCGFSAARIAGPESELLLLAVDPARRGRGIGGRLLAEWRDWGGGEGTQELLSDMRAEHERAHPHTPARFCPERRAPGHSRSGRERHRRREGK